MTALLAVATILVSAVAQAFFSDVSPRLAWFFDLPLVAVIYYGIAKGPTSALMVGTGAGLVQDSLQGTLLGVNALSKAVVGYAVGVAGLRVAVASAPMRILMLAVATVLSRSVEIGTLAIMGRRLAYSPIPQLIGPVMGNCLIGVVALGVLKPKGPD